MAEAARGLTNSPRPGWALTSAASAVRVRTDVVDDVIWALRIGGRVNTLHSTKNIEVESVPNLPGDHMVGAGGVAADAEPADSQADVFNQPPTQGAGLALSLISASALPTPERFRPPGPPMFGFPKIAF